MLEIYVDADACPVKGEVYKVAERLGLKVIVVSNSFMRTPRQSPQVRCVVVSEGLDVADDWIAEHIEKNDICITADIPLASRCLEKGARVLGSRGKEFSKDSIGEILATRDLLFSLREQGLVSGGPAPISKKDRSNFLNKLDQIIQTIKNSLA